MNSDQLQQIQQILQSKKETPLNNHTVVNYADLRADVLNQELQQEVDFLLKSLESPEDFEEHFKLRCLTRQTDKDQSIPFSVNSNSPANQLMFQIALVLFKPATMRDMFALLMPGIKSYLSIRYPDSIPTGLNAVERKEFLKNPQPVFDIMPAEHYFSDAAPSFEEFSHYVISDTVVFDARDINEFSLPFLCHVFDHLYKHQHELYQKLCNHSQVFQQLEMDVKIYKSKALPLKKIIEQFIGDLELGGSKYTNEELASRVATKATSRFSELYEDLPKDARDSLDGLKGKGITFKKVLKRLIVYGECVETTAANLKEILLANEQAAVLNTPLRMEPDDYRQLINKYNNQKGFGLEEPAKKKLLDTQKKPIGNEFLPKLFLEIAIQKIKVESFDDLINLLLQMPPAFYDKLFEHILFDEPKLYLKTLLKILKRELLNSEQSQSLIDAIIKHYPRLGLRHPLIHWAKYSKSPLIFLKMMASYPQQERFHQFSYLAVSEKKSLSKLIFCKETVLQFMEWFSDEQLKELMKTPLLSGKSLLDDAILNPDYFKVLQDHLPKERLFIWMNSNGWLSNDEKTCDLLDKAIDHPQSLKILIDYTPEDHVQRIIDTILDDSVANVQSLKFVLAHYPQDKHLELILQNEPNLLQRSVDYPESLEYLLSLIPKHNLLETITQYGLVSRAAFKHSSLELILKIYPINQRVASVQAKSFGDQSALDYSANEPRVQYTILKLLPENQQIEALKDLILRKGYYLMMSEEYALKQILGLIPEDEYLSIFNKTEWGKGLIDLISRNVLKLGTPERSWPNSFLADYLILVQLETKIKYRYENPQEYQAEKRVSYVDLYRHQFILKNINQLNNFAEIQDYLSSYLRTHPQASLNKIWLKEFQNQDPALLTITDLITRWDGSEHADEETMLYRNSIKDFLVLNRIKLPGKCDKRKQFDSFLQELADNPAMELAELKNMVTNIKKVAAIHRDTGAYGFFKLTWARETASYNELATFFDLDNDNEARMPWRQL